MQLSLGHDVIAYASKDLFDASGRIIAKIAAETYVAKPLGTAQLLHDAAEAHSYLWGMTSARKELWALFDPDCSYCHMLFEALRPKVEGGALKVHVIQVAFLKPEGIGRAAAIVGCKDPAAALVRDEIRFDIAAEQGGIEAEPTSNTASSRVRANNAWMAARGIRATPFLLYRDRDGEPRAIPGFPPDVAALLSEIRSGS
ncbi:MULTISPECIES: hypothetical protein [Burkholderia]|uniref:hypothetical protein n=1 Tax=Burkholderia TaxID=32008 RepID=UPI00065CD6E3|nr:MULTISPECIES: hypothetical protein [Burkholderia]KML19730.1 hypothetical protein VL00_05820 [Burkholderia cepacia]